MGIGRIIFVTAWVAAACGCRPRGPASVVVPPPRRVPISTANPVEPQLLSAHFAAEDSLALGRQDGILLVFSVEVDPASLRPSAFLVIGADGARSVPTEATFSPATESDENRSVMLVGEFGTQRAAPTDVVVFGSLHAERGQSLQGLLSPVTPFDAGLEMVAAQRRETGCEGGATRIRTYWNDVVLGVEPADLQAITVELAGGGGARPVAFEDHSPRWPERADNVLDLCVSAKPRIVSVWVDAGAFTDASGHQNSATKSMVARQAAPE